MGIRPSIYNTINIQKDDRIVDIRLATASIAFYEDILSPNITAKIQIVDVGGSTKLAGTGESLSLYEAMKVRGGEAVSIFIEPNSDSTLGIDLTENPLYVNSIKNVIREGNKEFFNMNLISRSGFDNEKNFIGEAFSENVGISEHVRTIVNKYFPYDSNNLDIDTTANKYGVIGNLRKPFNLLLDLASRSVFNRSETSSSAGFLFFQTLEKTYFKAIDNLVKSPVKAYLYYAEADGNSLTGDNTDYRILKYEIIKNQSIISNMRKGAYSTSRTFFDPVTHGVTDRDFDFTGAQYENKMDTLNDPISPEDRSIAFDSVSLDYIPTKIITETIDRGTNTKDVTTDQSKYIESYLSQRKVRYNSLFSQIISVQIASNTNIHAGDVIECNLPKLNGNVESAEYDYEQLSGKYLVKEVCHYFDSRGSYTSMKLVRDSFGFDTSS